MANVEYPGPGAIRALAAALTGAHEAVNDHPGDHRYTDPFHSALAALYSPQWEAVVAGAQQGENWAFDPAIDFLEADPRCFRAGYYKERLCPYLSRAHLAPDQRRRLAVIAARVLAGSDRPARERKAWDRLSSALSGDPSL